MAAVAKRQGAALAQQFFRNFNRLNIFLINFKKAFAAPFDEYRLRDKALETDVEHGIVNQPLIRYGQFAIVFPAVGRQVEKRPGIDRGFTGLECDFHECPFYCVAELTGAQFPADVSPTAELKRTAVLSMKSAVPLSTCEETLDVCLGRRLFWREIAIKR